MNASTENEIQDLQCKKIAVISDLHKYSGVSNFSKGSREDDPNGYWARRQEIFGAFAASDHVVLNGDIFDIQCSTQPHTKIAESIEWLKRRMDEAPDTKFHFLLGNHEAWPEFLTAMHELAADPSYSGRFSFHEHYLKINDSLFVHGDEFLHPGKYRLALEGDTSTSQLGNKQILKELRPWMRGAYETGNGLYHALKNNYQGLLDIVSKLHKGLKNSQIDGLQTAFEQSEHIFSGHIHEPYAAEYEGKFFYNTGAAVNSSLCPFCPMEIDMQDGKTGHVNALLMSDKARSAELVVTDLAKKDTNPLSFANLVTDDANAPAPRAVRQL